ncbi:guanylate kinase [candidate division KSB1 bacterium]|nr:guanylate kinase [candidate division KSB1 bacterium]
MSKHKKNGLLVVISSPSGGGKTTVIHRIIEMDDRRFTYSVSMTTREKRKGEVDGRDYFFVTKTEFEEYIRRGDLVEYEQVHDWYYGTPREFLLKSLQAGLIVLLDIDVYGALNIRQMFGEKFLSIFLKPPNKAVLMQRLLDRGSETREQINKRMKRVEKELQMSGRFDHIVINDRLEDTVEKVIEIILSKYNRNK